MAINTSNNKVRIISTTVGLANSSKYTEINSPALVVNTSDGGIFYADGTAKNPFKQLAALPNHTHSGYATQSWVGDNFLSKSGGELTGQLIVKGSGSSIVVHRTQSLAPLIKFSNVDGQLGQIGINNSDGRPLFIDSHTNFYTFAFTTDIPTRLSQLTDDLVAGKYLPLAGGTVNGETVLQHSNSFILTIKRTGSGASLIRYNNGAAGLLGGIGFDTDGVARIWDNTLSGNYPILTSNNFSQYALPLTGGTLTGQLKTLDNFGIILRHNDDNYLSGISSDSAGNECIALWAKNSVTRLRWHAGIDMSGTAYNKMMSITPDFEISKASGNAIGYIAGNTIIHGGNYTTYCASAGHTHTEYTSYKYAGATVDSTENYIILSLASNGTAISGGYFYGNVLFNRGGLAAWNGKTMAIVACGGQYTSNIGAYFTIGTSITIAGLYKIQYNNTYYLALKIGATSSQEVRVSGVYNTTPFIIKASDATSASQISASNLSTPGSITAANFITSSDKRLKTNIKSLPTNSKSLELNFYEFDYKDNDKHSAGHIAQEVKEVLPEFVHGNESETEHLSIDYTGLHSIQIKALLDRIIKLEEEIKILKSSK